MTEQVPTFQQCPICDGTCKSMNMHWQAFLSVWLVGPGGSPTDQVQEQQRYFRALGYDQVPPVMEVCSCCEGEGRVSGSIPLDDVFNEPLPAETASRLGLPPDVASNKPGTAPVDRPFWTPRGD